MRSGIHFASPAGSCVVVVSLMLTGQIQRNSAGNERKPGLALRGSKGKELKQKQIIILTDKRAGLCINCIFSRRKRDANYSLWIRAVVLMAPCVAVFVAEPPANPDKESHSGESLVVLATRRLITAFVMLLSELQLNSCFSFLQRRVGCRASCFCKTFPAASTGKRCPLRLTFDKVIHIQALPPEMERGMME